MKKVTPPLSLDLLVLKFSKIAFYLFCCFLLILIMPLMNNELEKLIFLNIILLIFNLYLCFSISEEKNLFRRFIILFYEVSLYSTILSFLFSGNYFFYLIPIPFFSVAAFAFNSYPRKFFKDKSKSLDIVFIVSFVCLILSIINSSALKKSVFTLSDTSKAWFIIPSILFFSLGLFATCKLFHEINIYEAKEYRKDYTLAISLFAALTQTIDAKDDYTVGHCDRVAKYAVLIGEKLGYSDDKLLALKWCGKVHDIGKIAVPDSILKSSSKLSPNERAKINLHPEHGKTILGVIDQLKELSIVAAQHHERYDGTGYPRKLKGSNIHPFARIMAVADSYDAMTSHRSYDDQPKTQERARNELLNNSGTQFDPKIVKVMVELIDEDKGFNLSHFPTKTGKKKKKGGAKTTVKAIGSTSSAVTNQGQSSDNTETEES